MDKKLLWQLILITGILTIIMAVIFFLWGDIGDLNPGAALGRIVVVVAAGTGIAIKANNELKKIVLIETAKRWAEAANPGNREIAKKWDETTKDEKGSE